MSVPRWVGLRAIVAIHDRQIARHGGTAGMRDRGLLEAGAARPLNRHAYGERDLARLGAAYAFGIAKAHAFIDGNKRTAFVAAATFLRVNGVARTFDQVEVVRMSEGLAEDTVDEVAFAAWLANGAIR